MHDTVDCVGDVRRRLGISLPGFDSACIGGGERGDRGQEARRGQTGGKYATGSRNMTSPVSEQSNGGVSVDNGGIALGKLGEPRELFFTELGRHRASQRFQAVIARRRSTVFLIGNMW